MLEQENSLQERKVSPKPYCALSGPSPVPHRTELQEISSEVKTALT